MDIKTDNAEVIKNIDKLLMAKLPKKMRESLEKKKQILTSNTTVEK